MSEWRETTGGHPTSSPVPSGATALPAAYHRMELYRACSGGKEIIVERDTQLSYSPPAPAAPAKSTIKTTTRVIHTGIDCPEGRRGEEVAWPGGISFPSPLPSAPAPPAPDRFAKEREARAVFQKRWDEATGTPPP